ncbi:hypothetical protein AMK19_23775 [Kitasatospora sp. CB01950]|nr:hypothetical protein AMK19_23775 [Kitasatospora sp. CB01950]
MGGTAGLALDALSGGEGVAAVGARAAHGSDAGQPLDHGDVGDRDITERLQEVAEFNGSPDLGQRSRRGTTGAGGLLRYRLRHGPEAAGQACASGRSQSDEAEARSDAQVAGGCVGVGLGQLIGGLGGGSDLSGLGAADDGEGGGAVEAAARRDASTGFARGLSARQLRVVQHDVGQLVLGVVGEVVGPTGHLVGAEPHVEVSTGVGADAEGQGVVHLPASGGARFRCPSTEGGRHQESCSE